jgi:methionyl-tRNA synthetase
MFDSISLKVKCPVCGESLMDKDNLVDQKPSLKLHLEIGNKKGTIYLSSIYGSYNHNCDIDTPEGELANFFCPHCKSQIVEETKCKLCDASLVPFNLDMGGRVSICSRSGCKNHFVEFENLSLALKKFYQEYGFGE